MDFNRRHDRVGHLFQNRYFSKLVEDDAYALLAIRYVHLNPVRAGVVPSPDALEEYPWTGHRALMGNCGNRFQDVAGVLAMLHDDPIRARRMLRAFMATDVDPREGGPVPPSGPPGGPPGGVIVPFPGLLPPSAPPHSPPVAPPPSPRERADLLRLQGWDLDRLIRRVSVLTGVPEADLRSGRRHRAVSRARALVAHFGRDDLCLPLEVLGRGLGIGGTGIARAIARGKDLATDGGWRFPP
jgi:hypothetical protein